MTESERLASFIRSASYNDMSNEARWQLKMRILDALGCAIAALDSEPIRMIREQERDFGGSSICSLIGGGHTAPDRAAFFNSALVRYLDFNDSFLAKGETCHPSDNFGAVLAAAEYAGASGDNLLTALAVAYQVHCRLSEVAPVRAKGFDHTTQGSYAVAAGVAKALDLDTEKTINAIAICGTAFNALRVTRTGALSHWKGLAYPNTAFCCTHGAFLAMRGITAPRQVFEGAKGFMDAISGPFVLDWEKEDLEIVRRTIIKKYNAEIHSQSAIEGVLELQDEHHFSWQEIERVDVDIFDVAFNIIGGGEEGEKTDITTKEQADHSLPYLVAVALIDGNVMPEQYRQERILRSDVQGLLRRVRVRPDDRYSRMFPEHHACSITVTLKDGRSFGREKEEYEGFLTKPISWDGMVAKFQRLAGPWLDDSLSSAIIGAVHELEHIRVRELTGLLGCVFVPEARY